VGLAAKATVAIIIIIASAKRLRFIPFFIPFSPFCFLHITRCSLQKAPHSRLRLSSSSRANLVIY
jgi:hypothetical protein